MYSLIHCFSIMILCVQQPLLEGVTHLGPHDQQIVNLGSEPNSVNQQMVIN